MTGAALVVRSNAATESALAIQRHHCAARATFFDIVADRCGQREQRRADAFDGIGDKAGAEVREAAVLRPGLGTKLLPGRSAHDHAIYDAASQHPREEGCGRKEKLGSRRGHCVALVRLAVAESCSAMHPATTGRAAFNQQIERSQQHAEVRPLLHAPCSKNRTAAAWAGEKSRSHGRAGSVS
jgi:hypothetical protein